MKASSSSHINTTLHEITMSSLAMLSPGQGLMRSRHEAAVQVNIC